MIFIWDFFMLRTPYETALLVALLLKRSGQKRARISNDTIKRISKRGVLRQAFLKSLKDELDDLGCAFGELERGGYGVIPWSALDGAPTITAKKYLGEDLDRLKRKEIDFVGIYEELFEVTDSNDINE